MISDMFEATGEFAARLMPLIDLPLYDDSARIVISDVSCSMALEHWQATLHALQAGLLPSTVVLHRAQFEALLRSIWLLYAASDDQVAKLTEGLSIETEQGAKNLPQTADMMKALERTGPAPAYEALKRFKDNSWKALNSYAHAGLHPLRRHADGYPSELAIGVLRNANGLASLTAMQAVTLAGAQLYQRAVLALTSEYPDCMPELL